MNKVIVNPLTRQAMLVDNVFCPTGAGGGVVPTCKVGGGGGSAGGGGGQTKELTLYSADWKRAVNEQREKLSTALPKMSYGTHEVQGLKHKVHKTQGKKGDMYQYIRDEKDIRSSTKMNERKFALDAAEEVVRSKYKVVIK